MTRGETINDERTRLVLADDADHLLELERSFFPEGEYDVTLARNGCDAYNLVKVVEPAVVFLDLFMPLINGEECCRLIKSDLRLRHTRVVLVSPDEEQLLRCCRDASCDLVLTKPVQRRDFIGAAQALAGPLHRAPARWPMRIAAELHDGRGCCLQSWSVNLSDKGAYLEGEEMPPLGQPYTLHLAAGEGDPLVIPVRIAWHNTSRAPRDTGLPSGFGVQFTDLTQETRLHLRKLIGGPPEAGDRSQPDRQGASRMFVELPMLTGKVI